MASPKARAPGGASGDRDEHVSGRQSASTATPLDRGSRLSASEYVYAPTAGEVVARGLGRSFLRDVGLPPGPFDTNDFTSNHRGCRRAVHVDVGRRSKGSAPRRHSGPAGGVVPETADAASTARPSPSPSASLLEEKAPTNRSLRQPARDAQRVRRPLHQCDVPNLARGSKYAHASGARFYRPIPHPPATPSPESPRATICSGGARPMSYRSPPRPRRDSAWLLVSEGTR